MAAKIEVYKGRAKGKNAWRWRLRSANQQVIASSHEAYVSKAGAKRAARTFQRLAGLAAVVEVD